MPPTPSTLNLSVPQVHVVPPSESSSSNSQGQEPEEDVYSDNPETASLPDSLHTPEVNVEIKEDYLDNQEEDNLTEDVPDHENLVPEPNITLTDDEINYLDEFFDKIGAVGGNIETHEFVEAPSDQDPQEYVQQFSPERVPDQVQQEEEGEDDDSQLIDYLRTFTYIQGQQPKKNDIIYYYDTDERNFMKVRIMSRSNYKY